MTNTSAPPTKPTERPEFALGMRLHNEGEYYEAHEAWEDIWRDEEIDEYRLFVQGLIQVTSAFHKLTFQKAPGGASRLLARNPRHPQEPATFLSLNRRRPGHRLR